MRSHDTLCKQCQCTQCALNTAKRKEKKKKSNLQNESEKNACSSSTAEVQLIYSTCRSHHLGCNHTADSLSPPPCPGQSSGAGPQRRGGPRTAWAPGSKHREKTLQKQILQHGRPKTGQSLRHSALKRHQNRLFFVNLDFL